MNLRSNLAISAIVAAVLFSIGYIIVVVIPGGGTVTEAEFNDYYVDGSFFFPLLLFFAMVAGAWSLIWFFSELRSRIPETQLSRVGFFAAVIGAAGLAVGAAILFAPSGVQLNSDEDFVGMDIAHTFAQAGLGVMLAVGMYSMALAVALFSIAFRQAAAAPAWVTIGGIVLAVLLLGSFVWAPGYLLTIWVLVVGLYGLRVAPTARRTAEGSPA